MLLTVPIMRLLSASVAINSQLELRASCHQHQQAAATALCCRGLHATLGTFTLVHWWLAKMCTRVLYNADI